MKRFTHGFLVGLFLACATSARSESVEWMRQLGTTSFDLSQGVSADGLGNVYISGSTRGSLGGPNAGSFDAFVSKYDSAGSLLWTRQLGTTSEDVSEGVSADGLGNVYVSGTTGGSLGGPNPGDLADAFVSKYDSAGSLLWTRQLRTTNSDYLNRVSADGLGNVYLAGNTRGNLGGPNAGGVIDSYTVDSFVSKYDANGGLLWTRQLGTTGSDLCQDVSADGLGSVFITGWTEGSLGGPNAGIYDAFVSRFDAAGNLLWTRQLGTAREDASYGVSADGLGNVFISGWTLGSLGGPKAGGGDAFVSKYDAAGGLLWTRQFGTTNEDVGLGVSTDGLGNLYVSGTTGGSLGGRYAGGGVDAFVRKYDDAGSLLWTRQFGTTRNDFGEDVSADGLGNIFFSGLTNGSLGGPNAGEFDAFVVKIDDAVVPEPSSLAISTVGMLGLFAGTLQQRRRA